MIFPDIRSDMLCNIIPIRTYEYGDLKEKELFVWRTSSLKHTKDNILAWFVDDSRFEYVWLNKEGYTKRIIEIGYENVMSCDFSIWADSPRIEQFYNMYRNRSLALYWQDNGLKILPDLNWSDDKSLSASIVGQPKYAPVVIVESRTLGGQVGIANFINGLNYQIHHLEPKHVVIYGVSNRKYIDGKLLHCEFTWLKSWSEEHYTRRKGG